jgi:hypothetical protein
MTLPLGEDDRMTAFIPCIAEAENAVENCSMIISREFSHANKQILSRWSKFD